MTVAGCSHRRARAQHAVSGSSSSRRQLPFFVIRLAMALVTVASAISAQVPYERLVKADTEPGNWLMYSRTYDAQRFSPLDQITSENFAQLQPVWMYQIQDSGQIENTPLVVDEVMSLLSG